MGILINFKVRVRRRSSETGNEMSKLLLVCVVMIVSESLSQSQTLISDAWRRFKCSNGLKVNGFYDDEVRGGKTVIYACCPEGYWLARVEGAGAMCTDAKSISCTGNSCWGGNIVDPVGPNIDKSAAIN